MATSQDTNTAMGPDEFVSTMATAGYEVGMLIDVLHEYQGNTEAAAAFLMSSMGSTDRCVTGHSNKQCMQSTLP